MGSGCVGLRRSLHCVLLDWKAKLFFREEVRAETSRQVPCLIPLLDQIFRSRYYMSSRDAQVDIFIFEAYGIVSLQAENLPPQMLEF